MNVQTNSHERLWVYGTYEQSYLIMSQRRLTNYDDDHLTFQVRFISQMYSSTYVLIYQFRHSFIGDLVVSAFDKNSSER